MHVVDFLIFNLNDEPWFSKIILLPFPYFFPTFASKSLERLMIISTFHFKMTNHILKTNFMCFACIAELDKTAHFTMLPLCCFSGFLLSKNKVMHIKISPTINKYHTSETICISFNFSFERCFYRNIIHANFTYSLGKLCLQTLKDEEELISKIAVRLVTNLCSICTKCCIVWS